MGKHLIEDDKQKKLILSSVCSSKGKRSVIASQTSSVLEVYRINTNKKEEM